MAQDQREMLELLNFELKFLEDGGYGRSPRTPWRAWNAFEDSPSCLNFGDPDKPHPCGECWLMKFVPEGQRNQNQPCYFIPLTEKGETIEYFSRCGTKIELEDALKRWLRAEPITTASACTATWAPDPLKRGRSTQRTRICFRP